MVHEMMSSAESSEALGAFERLLALVDQHMSFQLVAVGKAGRTQLALVWLLAGVDSDMASQVSNLDEASLAGAADVGFLARMESHVRLQMVVARKPLVALRTFERLLARVRTFMVL